MTRPLRRWRRMGWLGRLLRFVVQRDGRAVRVGPANHNHDALAGLGNERPRKKGRQRGCAARLGGDLAVAP